jgi:hypothetical protein
MVLVHNAVGEDPRTKPGTVAPLLLVIFLLLVARLCPEIVQWEINCVVVLGVLHILCTLWYTYETTATMSFALLSDHALDASHVAGERARRDVTTHAHVDFALGEVVLGSGGDGKDNDGSADSADGPGRSAIVYRAPRGDKHTHCRLTDPSFGTNSQHFVVPAGTYRSITVHARPKAITRITHPDGQVRDVAMSKARFYFATPLSIPASSNVVLHAALVPDAHGLASLRWALYDAETPSPPALDTVWCEGPIAGLARSHARIREWWLEPLRPAAVPLATGTATRAKLA